MTDSTNLHIRLASEADRDTINISFNKHFLSDEPLNIYLDAYKAKNTSAYDSLPDHGLTLVAEIINKSDGSAKFAGFLMCEILKEPHTPFDQESADFESDRAEYEFLRLFRDMNATYDLYKMFNVHEMISLCVLSVVPECRGKSVGLRLCQEAIAIARSREYQLVFMDCTSAYSAIIAEKLTMECVGAIDYEGYFNSETTGEKLFHVDGVHTHMKRYVKTLK